MLFTLKTTILIYYPLVEKGCTMSVRALVRINEKTYEVETGKLPESAAAALKLALKEREDEKVKNIGNALKEALDTQEEKKTRIIRELREYRRIAQQRKDALKKIDDAFEYASESGNYVPWLKILGYDAYSLELEYAEFEKLSEITKKKEGE